MNTFLTQELSFERPSGDWEDHSVSVLKYPNGLRITLGRRPSEARPLNDVASTEFAEARRSLSRYEALETKSSTIGGFEAITHSLRHVEGAEQRRVLISVISTPHRVILLGVSGPEERKTLVDELHRSTCASFRLRKEGAS